MRWLVAMVCLTGCDLIFKLDSSAPLVDAPGDGRVPDTACLTPAGALSDPFDDTSVRPMWVEDKNSASNAIIETAGLLELHVDVAFTTSAIYTNAYYDLRESSFTVENRDPATPNTGDVLMELELLGYIRGSATGRTIRMNRKGDALKIEHFENNNASPLAMVAYDPDAHRFWRIRQDGPTTIWSTSPDNITHTDRFTIDFADPPTLVRPRLAAQSAGDAMFVSFDNLNPDPGPPVCTAETLVDDFDRIDEVVWGRKISMPECEVRVVDGALQLDTSSPDYRFCLLGSSSAYDLLDHHFGFEAEPQLSATCTARIQAELLDGTLARFDITTGELRANVVPAGQLVTETKKMATYDPVAHRYLRFRGAIGASGPEITWETSANGVDYELFIKAGGFVELSHMQFLFALEGIGEPCRVRYDNVNR